MQLPKSECANVEIINNAYLTLLIEKVAVQLVP